MRLAVILGILPWVFFLGFFNDTLLGVKFGVIAGFACLLLFNYQALKKGALLDWVAVVFFLSIGVLGWFLELPFVIHNSLLMENSVFFIASILTLVTHKPFSLEYAKTKVNEVYYQHPVFRRVHGWISFVWSVIFLTGAVLIILYRFGLGNSTWMLQNIPTNLILLGVLFTIFFPDLYQRAMMKGGVSSLPGLSGVKTVEIQGGAIGYRTIGRGPLLILLQGAKMNMHGWDPVLLKHLSRHFTVLIWDYPGMGYSSDNQCEWTTEAMARLLKKICDKLELKPLALMGYSMGGFIAQACAKRFPDFVKGLILMSTDGGGKNAIRQTVSRVDETNGFSLLFPAGARARVSQPFQQIFKAADLEGKVSSELLLKQQALVQDWYSAKSRERMDVSALIFVGEKDCIIPAENAHILQTLFKLSEVVTYEDAGHGLIYQYPRDISDRVTSFLSNVND